MSSTGGVEIIQWLIDTRDLWPEATKTQQLEDVAQRALALLTEEERAGVLKYYFVRDAKMSLASHLLKHYVLSKSLGIPWAQTKLTRDANKKPIFIDESRKQPLFFNVSHQAGIVALAAVRGYDGGPVEVGVDVVCVGERRKRDHQMIKAEGWSKFVDIHADVFGASEVQYLKADLLSTQPRLPALARQEEIWDVKLRSFYTLWCLREAYVKMTGEALLAEWLKDLEFRDFQAPTPAATLTQGAGDESETITKHHIVFKGKKLEDANICLRSLGQDFMTCTAIRTPTKKEDGLGWELQPFEPIEIDSIVQFVESEK